MPLESIQESKEQEMDSLDYKSKQRSSSKVPQERKQLFGWWDSKEQKRFIEGLQLHGRNWTEVAKVVGSRSSSQVRSHAQKFFLNPENQKKFPKNKAQVATRPRSIKRRLSLVLNSGDKKIKFDITDLPSAEKLVEPLKLDKDMPSQHYVEKATNPAIELWSTEEGVPEGFDSISFEIDELIEAESNAHLPRHDVTLYNRPEYCYEELSLIEPETLLEVFANEYSQSHDTENLFHIPLDESLLIL
mmetsp:Transcript_3756/g.4544  ORF Transcript_3756/g.4544 Transcript_3756/m.4544 type:complete len:245 (-) Transcript_3756:118-852(-)